MTGVGVVRRAADAWSRFWFSPVDPLAMGVVRSATGFVALAWLIALAGSADAVFGLNGWFDRHAFAEAAALPQGPPRAFGWSPLYLIGDHPAVLQLIYVAAIIIVGLLIIGVWPRLTAPATWLTIVSFGENPATETDDLVILGILSLYLAVGYGFLGFCGPGSISRRLAGPLVVGPFLPRATERPSLAANVAMRLLQVHFAVVVVASGLHKLQFGDWWAGVALWYQLYPPLDTTLAAARTHADDATGYLRLLSALAYAVLAWQIAFPAFAWRSETRWLLLAGALAGAVGLVWLYGMPVFGPAFAVGCLTYVTSGEWRSAGALLARRVRTAEIAAELPQRARG